MGTCTIRYSSRNIKHTSGFCMEKRWTRVYTIAHSCNQRSLGDNKRVPKDRRRYMFRKGQWWKISPPCGCDQRASGHPRRDPICELGVSFTGDKSRGDHPPPVCEEQSIWCLEIPSWEAWHHPAHQSPRQQWEHCLAPCHCWKALGGKNSIRLCTSLDKFLFEFKRSCKLCKYY